MVEDIAPEFNEKLTELKELTVQYRAGKLIESLQIKHGLKKSKNHEEL